MEQVNIETRIMAIDYGENRIGIALSDPLFTFAYPFTTLKNDSALLNNLETIIREKSIIKIILGLPPKRFKASEELSVKVMKLKSSLESLLKIKVILWDEEYSSLIAKEKIIESVVKKSKRKEKALLDQHSAAVILQEFLDSK